MVKKSMEQSMERIRKFIKALDKEDYIEFLYEIYMSHGDLDEVFRLCRLFNAPDDFKAEDVHWVAMNYFNCP